MSAPIDIEKTKVSSSNETVMQEVSLNEVSVEESASFSEGKVVESNFNLNNNLILQPDEPPERWKREDDKRLYRFVINYWDQSGDTLDDVYRRLKTNYKKEFGLWRTISREIDWKGPIRKIQNRFLMLSNMKGLSTREIELLRKLVAKKQNDPSIEWDSIAVIKLTFKHIVSNS